MPRPTPFDLVFEQAAQEIFPQIRVALDRAGHDPRDRDRFLMIREVVTLLRELRPEEGLGEGIDQLAALVHHAYLFWDAGSPTLDLAADLLTSSSPRPTEPDLTEPVAYYARVPERRIWAQVIPGHPHEPLDGCFVHFAPGQRELRVLGVFGIHPERVGFSVVEAVGPEPVGLTRADGTALFTPTLPGGAEARLFSLTGEEELLALGWRTKAPAAEVSEADGRWRA